MAYTWVCTAIADNSVPNCDMVYGMLADARHRLNPPVPANYFGNCLVARIVVRERAKLVAEDGLVTAVESISKAIKSLHGNGVLNNAEKMMKTLIQALDFGWGMPEKVEIVSIDGTGAVCICHGRDGGVELAWAAKKGVMETFTAAFAKGLEEL